MANYTTTVETEWSPEAAFGYLAEFSNVAEWDPGVSSARSISADPLSVGARFEVEASFLGRAVPLVYETIEISQPRMVTLRADSGTFVSLDTLTFEPAPGGGTAVTYDATLTFKGPLRIFDPALKLAFNRLGDKARDGLADRLAGQLPAPAAGSVA